MYCTLQVLNQIISDCGDVAISFPKQGTNETRVVLKGEKGALEAAKTRMEEIVKELVSKQYRLELKLKYLELTITGVIDFKWCHGNSLVM